MVAAFTATATAQVRQDIMRLLELQNPACQVTGFDRPNLFFDVRSPADKRSALLSLLRERRDKSGIVYCSTRAAVSYTHLDVYKRQGLWLPAAADTSPR